MIPDTGRATHCLLALPYVLFVCLFISNVTAQDESATNSPLWNKDYRHVHKSQVVAMNQHQYETAVSDARTILSENPQDGESLYFATLALAHLDRKDEAIAMLQQALAELPPRQRQALALCHDAQLSQSDAAAAMEISESALESLLARARRGLQAKLRPVPPDSAPAAPLTHENAP